MRKKTAFFIFSGIFLLILNNKISGQCAYKLAGTYSCSCGGELTLSDTNYPNSLSAGFSGSWSFSNFDCSRRTLGGGFGAGCVGYWSGTGTFSCDFNSIIIKGAFWDRMCDCYEDSTTYTFTRIGSILVTVTPACSGSNGTAKATLPGFGESDLYTYHWSNGETTSFAAGLSAGTYTLIVTNSCSSFRNTAYATIPYSSAPAVNLQFIKSYDGTHTQVEAIASGGNPSYSYVWYPQDSSYVVASNLTAGVYMVVATDANGCVAVDTISVTNVAPTIDAVTSQTEV